jgi:predicted RNase H-like nuclease
MPPGRNTGLAGRACGIDGYMGGWIAARLDDGGITWATASVTDIGALIEPGMSTGIDMPIGLLYTGLRQCDALARRDLPGASSRVFTTPTRPVLALGPDAPNELAQLTSHQTMGQGISKQARALGPRILALDAALEGLPGHRVIEVHPELSFAELSGRVLDRKKSPHGVEQRLTALAEWVPGVRGLVDLRPSRVPVDDALDALAALWSAVRWWGGIARTLPAGSAEPPFIAI